MSEEDDYRARAEESYRKHDTGAEDYYRNQANKLKEQREFYEKQKQRSDYAFHNSINNDYHYYNEEYLEHQERVSKFIVKVFWRIAFPILLIYGFIKAFISVNNIHSFTDFIAVIFKGSINIVIGILGWIWNHTFGILFSFIWGHLFIILSICFVMIVLYYLGKKQK